MPVSPVNTSTAPKTTTQGKSSLDMTDFLKLLTTQLQYQDPTDPMKSTDFYSQLAQMGTVQGVADLQNSTKMTQASALLGKTVSGVVTDPSGAVHQVSGKVSGVSLNSGVYSLSVDDGSGQMQTLQLNAVQTIGQ